MICSLEAQGLFSIIKCIYWQKECSLNISKIQKRYNKHDLVMELIEEGAIKIDDQGEITITFLDAQYQAFKERRNKLSQAGKKGGLVKKQATLKPPLSEVKATPKHIEEKRGEESRIEENKENKQLTKDVCDFFSVNEMKNMSAFKMLNAFVSVSGIDTTAFNAYKEYKHTTGEKIHGWQTFIGSREKGFEDGAWCSCDWASKIKDIPQQSNGIPSEPDLTWIATKGKDIQLYQKACKIWRENGFEYVQPEGSTKSIWREIKQ